jgi:hypothetical protein
MDKNNRPIARTRRAFKTNPTNMKYNVKRSVLGVVAFAFATMTVQMLNHFVVNKQHYAAISHLRAEPIIPLGLLAMFVEGIILVWLFPRVRGIGSA